MLHSAIDTAISIHHCQKLLQIVVSCKSVIIIEIIIEFQKKKTANFSSTFNELYQNNRHVQYTSISFCVFLCARDRHHAHSSYIGELPASVAATASHNLCFPQTSAGFSFCAVAPLRLCAFVVSPQLSSLCSALVSASSASSLVTFAPNTSILCTVLQYYIASSSSL